jgi:hypothetical protein
MDWVREETVPAGNGSNNGQDNNRNKRRKR